MNERQITRHRFQIALKTRYIFSSALGNSAMAGLILPLSSSTADACYIYHSNTHTGCPTCRCDVVEGVMAKSGIFTLIVRRKVNQTHTILSKHLPLTVLLTLRFFLNEGTILRG
jgi:hypothetical protein